jgi:hypothetical protein
MHCTHINTLILLPNTTDPTLPGASSAFTVRPHYGGPILCAVLLLLLLLALQPIAGLYFAAL